MLEAMAQGLPIVATPCATEGLNLVDGRHVLVATTPDDFRNALAQLAQSTQLGRSLSAAAFAHATERFSWQAIQKTLIIELTNVRRGNSPCSN
jgi:glycosyltransferase involved in cell wall biosynthesis